jgi:transposase InsO family protein
LSSSALKLTGSFADVARDERPASRGGGGGGGGGGWLTSQEAAERLGISVGQVNRRCGELWAGEGLARLMRGDDGRQRWHVRQDADDRLADEPTGEGGGGGDQVDPADARREAQARILDGLTRERREAVAARKLVVEEFEQAVADNASLAARGLPSMSKAELFKAFPGLALQRHGDRLLCGPKGFSETTLRRWIKGAAADDLAGLIDKRWQGARADDAVVGVVAGSGGPDYSQFLAECRTRWMHDASPSKAAIHKAVAIIARVKGWDVPASVRTTQLHLSASTTPAERVRRRGGPRKFEEDVQPRMDRDYSGLRSNEVWVGDHHRCDWMVSFVDVRTGELKHKRPWLTAWMDCRSRLIVGWRLYLHEPNADEVLLSFRQAAMAHGEPEVVLVDNGKDYNASVLRGSTTQERREARRRQKLRAKQRIDFGGDEMQTRASGAFTRRGIKVVNCLPYHGESKPIERWFGTLESQCGRIYFRDSYTGPDAKAKPEGLAGRLSRGLAPDLATSRRILADYLDAQYHQQPHAGHAMDKRTPAEVYAAEWQGQSKRVASPDRLWWEYCSRPKLGTAAAPGVKVGQHGVTFDTRHYGKGDPRLLDRIGERVQLVVDPEDYSRVGVETFDGRQIGLFASNERIPFLADGQTARRERRLVSQAKQHVRRGDEGRLKLAEHPADALSAVAEQQRAEDADRQPPPASPADDGLDLAAMRAEAERAEMERDRVDFRQAAGGEHYAGPQPTGTYGHAAGDDGDELPDPDAIDYGFDEEDDVT